LIPVSASVAAAARTTTAPWRRVADRDRDVIFATGVFIALARMVNACMSLVEACGGARAKCYVRLLSSRRRERTERRTRGVL
jgi:hypothetical protein